MSQKRTTSPSTASRNGHTLELDELPEGWVWTALGQLLAKIEAGRSPKNQGRPAKEGEYGVLKVSAVTWGEFLPDENKALLPSDTPDDEPMVQARDLLITRANTTNLIGAVVLVKQDHPHLMLSDKTLRLVPASDAIPREFLLYALRTQLARDYFAEHATGTSDSMRNISQEKIAQVPIPLPPLAEQRRIVATLDAAFAQSRTAREALEAVPRLAQQFRQSVLAAAFSGRLVEQNPDDEPVSVLLERIREERRLQWEQEQRAKGRDPRLYAYQEPAAPGTAGLPELPEGWMWVTVDSLAEVGTGATPLRKMNAYYEGGTIPWITSGSLNDFFVDEADECITPLAVAETNAKVFPVGTLLVAMYGEGRTRGKVSELRIEAATNQACAALVFRGLAAESKDFVKYFFLKNYEDIRRLSAGGVQPNLNLSVIKRSLIPLPPLAEQRRIVAKVEALFAQADALEAAALAARRRLEQLDQALLAQAFRGELVEQDPDDEPASVLLERIKAEQAAGQQGKGKRRGRRSAQMQEYAKPTLWDGES
jgi:type I restriction enzyme, S subunit